MSYTSIKYDSCNGDNDCRMSQQVFDYQTNLAKYENVNKCNANKNTNISINNSAIAKKINIENELKGLNNTLGNCNNNSSTLCNLFVNKNNNNNNNSNMPAICNTLTEVPILCNRSMINYGQNANFNCNYN
jgi:hypothetical protein